MSQAGQIATDKKFLQALQGEKLQTPPVWLMRQAGRYLPEYLELRKQAGSFLNLCYSPKMAAEVTLQPIRRYGFDAAILFSDILVVPDALGQDVQIVLGFVPGVSTAANVGLAGGRGFADAYKKTLEQGGTQEQAVKAGIMNAAAQAGLSWGVGKVTGKASDRLVKNTRGFGKTVEKTVRSTANAGAYLGTKTGEYAVSKVAGDSATDASVSIARAKGKGYSNQVPSGVYVQPMLR